MKTIDPHRLNEARWAACNTRWIDGHVPTMEKASKVADEAVRAYLGMSPEEWDEAGIVWDTNTLIDEINGRASE